MANDANDTKEQPMRLPWQPREYERTCADCGYTWQVPHRFARRRVQSVSMFDHPMYRGGLDPKSLEHSEFDGEVAASMEISKETGAFKACPKCGSESYTQSPGRQPPP